MEYILDTLRIVNIAPDKSFDDMYEHNVEKRLSTSFKRVGQSIERAQLVYKKQKLPAEPARK